MGRMIVAGNLRSDHVLPLAGLAKHVERGVLPNAPARRSGGRPSELATAPAGPFL